ncbi:MAG: hypothetical protein PHW96_00355 [Candidatus Nanoarchaeia archaeon]|nr:hypothetical protein [Candidatus Nanoarchaeia archaeon]
MKTKTALAILFSVFLLGSTAYAVEGAELEEGMDVVVTSFEEPDTTCISPTGLIMGIEEALEIAGAGDCAISGTLASEGTCNDVTGTWWIDLVLNEPMEGCSPACVVDIETGESEINYRCTGLVIEETSEETTEEVEIPEETKAEAVIMAYQHGAEVRLLQLELAIEKAIVHANDIIANILERDESADVSELEAIVAEMQVLKEEVTSLEISGMTADESAKQFVELKQDAVELTQSFKTKVHEMLPNQSVRAQIKESVENKIRNELAETQLRVQENVREYNALRVESLFRETNGDAVQIAQQVMNGELNAVQIREQIKERIETFEQAVKNQVLVKAKEDITRAVVSRNTVVNEVMENYANQKIERLQTRAENVAGILSDSDVVGKVVENINDRIESTQARIQISVGNGMLGTANNNGGNNQ